MPTSMLQRIASASAQLLAERSPIAATERAAAARPGSVLVEAIHRSPRQVAQRNMITASMGKGVLQGYFRKMFGKLLESDPDVQSVRNYMRIKSLDPALFEAALKDEKTDHGLLETWVKSNLQVSMETVRNPWTESLPAEWVRRINPNTNTGGPALVTVPSPQGTPTSSQEFDMEEVEESKLQPTDHVVDLNKGSYLAGKTSYDITPRDRSDVRAATMLSNNVLRHTGPMQVGDSSTITTDIPKQSGVNKGDLKTISEASSDLTSKERKREPALYGPNQGQRTFVMHNPDISLSHTHYSLSGWMPGSEGANTLMAYGSGLGGTQHPKGSNVGRFVVKEPGGRHMAYSLEGRAHRKKIGATAVAKEEKGTPAPEREEKGGTVDLLSEDEAEGPDIDQVLADLRRRLDEAGLPGQAEWDAVEAVLERLEIAVSDGEGQGLGQLADYYLDMTYDQLTQTTMQPSQALAEIAQEMRAL